MCKEAVLLAGGSIDDYAKIKDLIPKNSYLVCADRGYDHALQMGLVPALVIGDMDSVKHDIPDCIPQIVRNPKKDETDTQLALDYLTEKGYNKIRLFACLGGRIDHQYANLQLLERYYRKNIWLSMEDETSEIFLIGDGMRLEVIGCHGDIVSVFAVSKAAEGIDMEHLEYALHHGTLHRDTPMGISNVMLADTCSISVDKGILLIIHMKNGVSDVDERRDERAGTRI